MAVIAVFRKPENLFTISLIIIKTLSRFAPVLSCVYFLLLNPAGAELRILMKSVIYGMGDRKINVYSNKIHKLKRSHPEPRRPHQRIDGLHIGDVFLQYLQRLHIIMPGYPINDKTGRVLCKNRTS